MMFKNRNNSHNMSKINNTSYNANNNISQANEQKFANSYFNTIFSHEDNKKKTMMIIIFHYHRIWGIKRMMF